MAKEHVFDVVPICVGVMSIICGFVSDTPKATWCVGSDQILARALPSAIADEQHAGRPEVIGATVIIVGYVAIGLTGNWKPTTTVGDVLRHLVCAEDHHDDSPDRHGPAVVDQSRGRHDHVSDRANPRPGQAVQASRTGFTRTNEARS